MKTYISLAVATVLATSFVGCGGASSSGGDTTSGVSNTGSNDVLALARSEQPFQMEKITEIEITNSDVISLAEERALISIDPEVDSDDFANLYVDLYLSEKEVSTENPDGTIDTQYVLADKITRVRLDSTGNYKGYIQAAANVDKIYAQIPSYPIFEIAINNGVGTVVNTERYIKDNKVKAQWDPSRDKNGWSYVSDSYVAKSTKAKGVFDGAGISESDHKEANAENRFNIVDEKDKDSIVKVLLDRKNAVTENPQLFKKDGPRMMMAEDGEVFVTFYYEGAGYRNVLGYYAYDDDGSITGNTYPENRNDFRNKIQNSGKIIFPNVSRERSGGLLNWGDTLSLGEHKAGTKFIFFIVSNGWKYDGQGGAYVRTPNYNVFSTENIFNDEYDENPNPQTTKGNPNSKCYEDDCTNNETIKDYSHVVMMKNLVDSDHDGEIEPGEHTFVMAFEDINRQYSSCDHDFEDTVFSVSATPPSSLTGNIEINPRDKDNYNPDRDGDGVEDTLDEFPDDKDRAYISYYPSDSGQVTLAFEDLWPTEGDMDLNDLVIPLSEKKITDSSHKVKDIELNFEVIASGANFDNGFSFKINSDISNIDSLTINGTSVSPVADGSGAIVDVFDKIKSELGYAGGSAGYYNTQVPSSSQALFSGLTYLTGDKPWADGSMTHNNYPTYNVKITFKHSVEINTIGLAPYDPFMRIDSDNSREVHLPNYAPTQRSGIDASEDYLGANDLPWAVLIPTRFTKYPLESIHIEDAYSNYSAWKNSEFKSNVNWYEDKVTNFKNQSYIFLGH